MRTLEVSLAWMADGTTLCAKAIGELDEPSLLPSWTRKHVVAHLAANAEALGNLVHWAKTGEETPMYTSPEQRNADIEAGAQLPADRVVAWFEESAQKLAQSIGDLTEAQWENQVRTAQGREVPATEIPWMRTREVMIHAVDLGTGVSFHDLPVEFLEELCLDIRAKRGSVPEVQGPLPEVAAYLAGRPNVLNAEPLPPWL
ncbi:maleylpyruvate isomerase [Kribbella antiqua]|uniref:Maleylpyruvate isomerase n=1 Tax=Kribbella antiqua TaxID=2512217 RepID=A0A4R2IXY2_9ACTN|nr:maleylpyruvate isomerase family mycothiol-dependent enzyme [Kribbella antiqua]TCO50414.1 maleylpyruvate isomerase [Kribbella antiqua]